MNGIKEQQQATKHGWIILNKPVGMSSAKAVGIIRRFFGGIKTGHAGTLDPLACGVLPIALGEATKTISLPHSGELKLKLMTVKVKLLERLVIVRLLMKSRLCCLVLQV